uniref:Putative secreted protein n=1 Tax=Ixodes ricinus TaxID=34613 RepID=A0A6B0U9S5_IXORI
MLRHSSRTPPGMCASAVSPSCLCLWCPSSSSLPSAPCSSARSGTDAGRFRASMSPRALLSKSPVIHSAFGSQSGRARESRRIHRSH